MALMDCWMRPEASVAFAMILVTGMISKTFAACDQRTASIRLREPGNERGRVQSKLHALLSNYVNHGVLSRGDRILSAFCTGLVFQKNARKMVETYTAFSDLGYEREASPLRIKIDLYEGGNQFVRRMIGLLASRVAEDLCGAYVHGSLGTGEEIPYSDFDTLVIIKDSVMRDPRRLAPLARELSRALQIMFEADPLQHHGWFVLTEADLAHHCDAFFPHELFDFSKSMLTGQGLELELSPRDSSMEVRESFVGVATSLRRSVQAGRALENMYELKNTLSLFMLLPALYVQVRDGQGIFKKFSFEAARVDFARDEWACMDRVSEIRKDWRYEISPFRRKLLSRPWPIRRQLLKLLAPPISNDIRQRLTVDLFTDMGRLAQRMAGNLGLQ